MKKFCFSLCAVLIMRTNWVLGSEAGMPQLNPEFWLSQVFWLIIVFSILYLTILKIFIPKITNSIENRKSKIVDDLQEAQNFKNEAEKKLLEYDKIINDAKNEAKKIISDGRKKLDEDINNKKQKFNEEIEKELAVIDKEIKKLKETSIPNISKIAVEVSTQVMKEMMDTEVNESNVSAIVNELIKKKLDKRT